MNGYEIAIIMNTIDYFFNENPRQKAKHEAEKYIDYMLMVTHMDDTLYRAFNVYIERKGR